MLTVDATHPDLLVPALRRTLAGGPALLPLPSGTTAARAITGAVRPAEPAAPGTVIVTTSGSTGQPKGICLSAAAITASAESTLRSLGGPGAWHLALPAHYVAGLMVIARAIVSDAQVLTVRSDLDDLHPVAGGRNYLSIVPTQAARALQQPAVLERLAAFDAVLLGGGAAGGELLDRLTAQGVRVRTTYGMSETCGGCVYDGSPLDITEVRIGAGQRIELRGPMLFDGYRLQPELTARVLADGWFVTSDRGELAGDRLRVLGRVDDVVISGGVNVDLARLQTRLDGLTTDGLGPGRAVALGVPDPEWGQRVVVATTAPIGLTALRDRLTDLVEPAALPRGLGRVDELPLLSSGKPDRRSLIENWPMIEEERR
ncbi:AMP-binding protein [Naumannella halotolerans]|uniref:O-succinylbenzoic acid--CoA ligase n=1 Tax=Naumannella halotolerans TaxID=993414 RepID=A0A4R7JAT3_9ACTN|nr:AMP-binding protein [Naumannella halotolerans]TDT34464.1 O-succinylbenzoic acid--CoA ligase [Naumannella halotolerans]